MAIINDPRESKSGDDEESRLYPGYWDAQPDALMPMAHGLRDLAARQGHGRVSCKVLNDPEFLTALEAAGYARRWDMDVLLFVRDLSLTEHAQIVNGPAE